MFSKWVKFDVTILALEEGLATIPPKKNDENKGPINKNQIQNWA